jgi:hypothetical protein
VEMELMFEENECCNSARCCVRQCLRLCMCVQHLSIFTKTFKSKAQEVTAK